MKTVFEKKRTLGKGSGGGDEGDSGEEPFWKYT